MTVAPLHDTLNRAVQSRSASFATAFAALLACMGAGAAELQPPGVASATSTNVLIVGNSLSYVNNLPALFNAIDATQSGTTRMHADLLAAPGGSLSERWKDGVAAQEIASGNWQVLVLQERGGTLACLAKPQQREQAACRASVAAHREFADLAHKRGMRVVLLGTWGPDSIWQAQLGRGMRQLAKKFGADALDVGAQLRTHAASDPATPMTQDAMGHPSLDGSLLIALSLYAALAGHRAEPADIVVTAALLPPAAAVSAHSLMSEQPQLAGDGRETKATAGRLRALQP